jgi:hypothetical protein
MMTFKTRVFPEHNYLSIFDGKKTIRFQIEDEKPITELDYPEFYDVKITNYCTGNCQYCYQDSGVEEEGYTNAYIKLHDYFDAMTENQRPFQVAIGGGNPNQHKDFVEILKMFHDLGVVPNYTTNGIGLTDKILEATEQYCGGVAVSCHEHLWKHWCKATEQLTDIGVQTNHHIIISDKESIDVMVEIVNSWDDVVSYFVLLPYTEKGRAIEKEIDYECLTKKLDSMALEQIAFGAGFYEYLQGKDYPVSLYEPELMSGYLDAKDLNLYKSSFDLTLKEVKRC